MSAQAKISGGRKYPWLHKFSRTNNGINLFCRRRLGKVQTNHTNQMKPTRRQSGEATAMVLISVANPPHDQRTHQEDRQKKNICPVVVHSNLTLSLSMPALPCEYGLQQR